MEKHTFEITETFEVTFPHFRKKYQYAYKVLDKDYEVKVALTNTNAVVSYDTICKSNTFGAGSYEITEEEFNETMARAYQLILNKNN